ncbi:MAG: PAS-domain containing protein [Alphaproteobacteria bacterium]|nr:PAS-domain containing protein [Alphaproteobacteria bacterium]
MPIDFAITSWSQARRLKLWLAAVVAAILLVLWTLAVLSNVNARRVALENAARQADNLSAAFADEVSRTVTDIVGTMKVVAEKIVAHHGKISVYDMRRNIARTSNGVVQAAFIGPDGWMRSTTAEPHPAPLNLGDREHFRVHVDGAHPGLFISKPVTGRVSKQVTIQLTQRIEDASGKFLGVLVFSVPPAALTSLPRMIDLGPRGVIGLIGTDNVLRARFSTTSPDGLEDIGRTIIGHPTAAEAAAAGKPIVRTSVIDHVTRIFSNRWVPGYPLVVGVGLDRADALAAANAHAVTDLSLVGTASLILFLLVLYLRREIDRRTAHAIALGEEHHKLELANADLAVSKRLAEAAETRLTEAIECISEPFVIYDEDDRLVLCNQAFRGTFPHAKYPDLRGVKFDDLIADSLAEGIFKAPPGGRDVWLAERREKHRHAESTLQIQLMDGRHMLATDRRMKSGGFAGLRVDVTKLVHAQEALEGALTEARAANEAKTLFLANMSHELRTPLNAVIGFSEIIKSEMMGPVGVPAYADYAADINNAGHHLLGLVGNILDASRIEAGKFELCEEPVVIAELVHGALQAVRSQAEKKSLTLVERVPGHPATLYADPLRLRQVLINLLSNAVKFTPADGRVTLFFQVSAQRATFAVVDTGIGMTPEEAKAAVEPFRQIDNALVKRYEGVGLGLSLAKRITEMHGGTLELHSNTGTGTTVRIHLPIERVLDGAGGTHHAGAAVA